MSDQDETSSEPSGMQDSEACRLLNHEDLLLRVRRMNDDMKATLIPKHDVPISLVVRDMSQEKKAVSWSRLCESFGMSGVAKHIRRAVLSRTPERVLSWESDYPRGSSCWSYKPPMFEDEPSESSDDETDDK